MNGYLDTFLPVAEPDLGLLEERYVMDALRSGWVSSIGAYIQKFEVEFAELCGVTHAIAVSNGTVAIHVALVAAGIGPGDEVIVPALTFVATAAVVRHAGAEPVFVDSEPEIGTLDLKAVERAISPKTKAIIPVHLYGHPADMDPIVAIAKARNLVVVEDAAEAHGAKYKGRLVGGMGKMGTYSFYGNKILTTGEGGAVITDDDALAARLRFLKDHAMDPKRRYWHPEVGYNYRMTNLQAAMGCAQIERFHELCAKRTHVVDLYREVFQGSGVTINPCKPWAEPVPWLVCALLPEGTTRERRDGLMAKLKSVKIDSRPYFHLLCDMPPYASCRRVGADGGAALPVAEDLSRRGLNLPSVNTITTKQASRIRDAFDDLPKGS